MTPTKKRLNQQATDFSYLSMRRNWAYGLIRVIRYYRYRIKQIHPPCNDQMARELEKYKASLERAKKDLEATFKMRHQPFTWR